MTELLTALVEGKPLKKGWWFDNDYIKFVNGELLRFSEGHETENCNDAVFEILSSIVNNPDDWIIGKKEVK